MNTKAPPSLRVAWTDEDAQRRPRRRRRIPVATLAFGLFAASIPGAVFVYCTTLTQSASTVIAEIEVPAQSSSVPLPSPAMTVTEKIASLDTVEQAYIETNDRLAEALKRHTETEVEALAPIQVAAKSPAAPTNSISAINRLMSVGRVDDRTVAPEMAMSFAPSDEPRSSRWLPLLENASGITAADDVAAGKVLETATVHRPVNFRVSPGKGRVMRVLPRGTVAELHDPDCTSWCQVTALGATGYVSRDFLRR